MIARLESFPVYRYPFRESWNSQIPPEPEGPLAGDNLTFAHRLDGTLSGHGKHAGAQQRDKDADKDDQQAD